MEGTGGAAIAVVVINPATESAEGQVSPFAAVALHQRLNANMLCDRIIDTYHSCAYASSIAFCRFFRSSYQFCRNAISASILSGSGNGELSASASLCNSSEHLP